MPAGQRPEPPLLLAGLDFRTAPLPLRERVAYGASEGEELLIRLLARPEVAEALLLSTCNRTEVYVVPRDDREALPSVLDLAFLGHEPELSRPGHLFVQGGGEAARHLLAVACGLESMVLGEPEILGQVRQAAGLSEAVGAAGPVLRHLLASALSAGARARSETAIGAGAVSLGYAVAELARSIFRDLSRCRALLVGAGEIARSVARDLMEKEVTELTVANRDPARAECFVAELPGTRLIPFSERVEAAAGADLVIVSTGADEPVLTRDQLAAAMHGRPPRPLLVVDLGVPRNVDPTAGKIENLFLHSLDSLDHLIQRNLKKRKEEVPKVEEILDQEMARFRSWYRGLEAEPLIARLQKQAEGIRAHEVTLALSRFPPETHTELERLTRSLVRKILHHPSARLRSRDTSQSLPHLDLVRELFQLDDEPR